VENDSESNNCASHFKIGPVRGLKFLFKIKSTIAPWIAQHEVQLLINRIWDKYSDSEKKSVVLFTSFVENCGNHLKEFIKACTINTAITWVSKYKYPITKSSNWIPVNRHQHDHALITWQMGMQSNHHDQEFCYRYDWGYDFRITLSQSGALVIQSVKVFLQYSEIKPVQTLFQFRLKSSVIHIHMTYLTSWK